MLQCLELAEKGKGAVAPNPMVGALLVHNQEIIGEGYHEFYGGPHAEVNCLHSVKEEHRSLIPDSILYVSLEPCNHTGKTPPCTDLILASGIRHVVIGCVDSSSTVNGQGIARLRQEGVHVVIGVEEDNAIELNKRFFTYHQCKRPYIILKWAESKEAYIGCPNRRVLLSSEECNVVTHQWRADEAAIWVGYHTAKLDNPHLTVRHSKGNNPLRIVYDSDLSLPNELNLFDHQIPTLRFNHIRNSEEENLSAVQVNEENSLQDMLHYLYQQHILSVIIEGGAKWIQHFIDQGCWDEARVIRTATSLTQGVKAPTIKNALLAQELTVGPDQIYFYKKQ